MGLENFSEALTRLLALAEVSGVGRLEIAQGGGEGRGCLEQIQGFQHDGGYGGIS